MVRALCQYYGFTNTTLSFNSMLNLTAQPVACALSIKRKIVHHRIQRRRLIRTSVFIWLTAILWGAFPFFGWSNFVPESKQKVCAVDWGSSKPLDIIYIVCILLLFYVIPIAVTVISYSSIFRDMSDMTKNARVRWGCDSFLTRSTSLGKVRVARQAFAMTTGFIIC
ncbi:predicted protein [Nematostella vectensis]|uniref:G-protein coupled receptors family 1 profile domain-containing protein n=1 Tax=Nematostella vectensis TaxID=45351 RepID=A7S4B1_NEMVE|nr:predicted protein [Nematostella vectensis]|eukprot:XP_001633550.1 predicted protein [Nematostella vectensis]